MLIKQSTAVSPLLFLMIDSGDHITGKTGLAPTVTISKNGGAFATPLGAVTELSSGWYKIAPHANDSNTLGQIAIHATAAGADPCDDKSYEIVAFNPQSGTDLGLSTLTGNVRQTGDAYAIVSDAAFGNAKLVRSTTPANTLSIDNVGSVIRVVDVIGGIGGNVTGKVLGGGDSDITGPGAWVLGETGSGIAAAVSKTGYKLASDGLDSITVTPPTTVAATLPSMMVQLWRRYFKKATLTSTQLKTLADDGSTVVTTQTVSNDGTTQTQGPAA